MKRKMSLCGGILRDLDYFILNIINFIIRIFDYFKKFFHAEESFFEIVFILIYFAEQLGLFFYLIYNPHTDVTTLIGIFVLILLTTKATEKIFMQSRNKYLKNEVVRLESSLKIENQNYNLSHQKLLQDYNSLNQAYNNLFNEYHKNKKKLKNRD